MRVSRRVPPTPPQLDQKNTQMSPPIAPTTKRMIPIVGMLNPCPVTATRKTKNAPTAISRRLTPIPTVVSFRGGRTIRFSTRWNRPPPNGQPGGLGTANTTLQVQPAADEQRSLLTGSRVSAKAGFATNWRQLIVGQLLETEQAPP